MGRGLVAPPGSLPEEGDAVTYTTLRDEFRRPPEFPATEETPWTHGGPPVLARGDDPPPCSPGDTPGPPAPGARPIAGTAILSDALDADLEEIAREEWS